jgi:RHS repeat-associated protein
MLTAAFKPSVTSGGSSTTLTYTYDENGKRVMLIDPTGTTTRYYSGLYQDTLGGYKKTKNIFVNGVLLATFEKTGSASATPYYVLTDPLNSASILMNSSGVATQTLDYLPYGDVRVNAKQTSYDSDRKYIGKINDVATNLDYLEARYYQSPLGRFISQDPMQWGVPSAIGDPQSLNYYSYANGNPINLTDPSGLRAFTASEISSNQATFAEIDKLYAMGKNAVAQQMTTNLYAYIHEIEAIPTTVVAPISSGGGGGGGGSTVTQTPVVTAAQGGGSANRSVGPVGDGSVLSHASAYGQYYSAVHNAVFDPYNSLTYDNFANSSGPERIGLAQGSLVQGIMWAGGGVERVGVGFFEGTVDRAIIWKKANVDEFHNVPDIIRTFENEGKVVSKGLYKQLNIPGSYLSPGSFENPGTWYNGQFEFGKIGNQIVHMLFRPTK